MIEHVSQLTPEHKARVAELRAAKQAQDPTWTPCEPAGECPGWAHFTSGHGDEIQRCDECALYANDDDAAKDHAAMCGCDWDKDKDTCPECEGSGHRMPVGPCAECHGKGVVPA